MDIKIGDKVRFNQKGLDTLANSSIDWAGIAPDCVNQAKRLGTGTVLKRDVTSDQEVYLAIDFQDPHIPFLFWPVEMFEKVPEEKEKLELTREEKELLRELVQDKLKGYQELLNKLR